MFNTTIPFPVTLLSGTEKKLVVNYPNDPQVLDLYGKRKSILRRGTKSWDNLGDHGALDLALFDDLRVSGPDLDDVEASRVINRLLAAEVLLVERNGNTFEVTMTAFGGHQVVHTLTMPTERQMVQHENATSTRTPTAKGTLLQVSLQPSLELWTALAGRASGYADGSDIPVTHKSNAVMGVFDKMRELENADPES